MDRGDVPAAAQLPHDHSARRELASHRADGREGRAARPPNDVPMRKNRFMRMAGASDTITARRAALLIGIVTGRSSRS